jgi:hypothetical protein
MEIRNTSVLIQLFFFVLSMINKIWNNTLLLKRNSLTSCKRVRNFSFVDIKIKNVLCRLSLARWCACCFKKRRPFFSFFSLTTYFTLPSSPYFFFLFFLMHVWQQEQMQRKSLFLSQGKNGIGWYNIKNHALWNILKILLFIHEGKRIRKFVTTRWKYEAIFRKKNSKNIYVNFTVNDFALNKRRRWMRISSFD